MKQNIYTDHKGFSLLEMACVLITMAILASAIIPVLTRSFLDKASEKVSLDISAIEDAARAYFIANGSWPMSILPTGTTPPTDLESDGFLPSSWNAINPFGNPYTVSIGGSVFTVSTQVMNGSQTSVVNSLPASYSTGNTVSSSVPVPGASTTGLGSWTSLNFNTIYQAISDGFLVGNVYLQAGISGTQSSSAEFYTSSMSPPSASPNAAIEIENYVAPGQTTNGIFPFCFPVRKGDFYELALTGGYESGISLKFIPLGT